MSGWVYWESFCDDYQSIQEGLYLNVCESYTDKTPIDDVGHAIHRILTCDVVGDRADKVLHHLLRLRQANNQKENNQC